MIRRNRTTQKIGGFRLVKIMSEVRELKTLQEKTDGLLEHLMHCDLRTSVGVDKARAVIRSVLREQDRDTKHA